VGGAARRWAATLAASAAPLVAGCGDDNTSASSITAPPAPGTRIALTIRYDDGTGRRAEGTVVCRPGVAHATADLAVRLPTARLCHDVHALAGLIAHKPGPRACAQIIGGPQTVRVTGTIDGRAVSRRFTQNDGCEIADYRRLTPILPLKR
jgi:hypothetical protein